MKKMVFILFILVLGGLLTGYYLINFGDDRVLGNKFVGYSIMTGVFVVMPIFLYIRFKDKDFKKMTWTPENIKRWKKKMKEKGF